MRADVVDLRDFYETHLGQVAQRSIRLGIRTVWPNLRGLDLLGLGYATPFLGPFRSEAARTVAFMPSAQGVVHWPSNGSGLVALVEETELPLADCSVDRVLLVHSIESSEYLRALLREVWRVLAGDGRLLVVTPNRRGIWARLERTPFGWGHPYTLAQLSQMLRANMFTPARGERALYIPPIRSRAVLSAAPAWERMGRRWFPTFAGVVMMEAGKTLYAASAQSQRRRLRRPIALPLPRHARRAETDEPR